MEPPRTDAAAEAPVTAPAGSVPIAPGKVFLVGAGPGDPALLTLRGRAVLETADTVVYDRLVPEELILDLPSRVLLIDAGKTPGNHRLPQEEINRILINEARQGRRVVRLKGGDPFLFGRGGEELLALTAAGIPFELVPGISAAIAVPAAAGIPVTHRGISSSLHILTWRSQEGASPTPGALKGIAQTGGTLVILMGGSALREIGASLIRAGFAPDTPAAVIEDGASPRQRVRRLCLQELAAPGTGPVAAAALSPAVAQAALSPLQMLSPAAAIKPGAPVLVVVGAVCALADTLGTGFTAAIAPAAASEALSPAATIPPSLAGLRIVVTRPEPQNAELCGKIRACGGRPIPFPCIKRVPLGGTEAYRKAGQSHWLIFTSATGVEIFFEGYLRGGGDLRIFGNCRFAAVGPATAETLARRGFIADYVPDVHNGRSLGQGLAERIKPGEEALLLRSREAHPELPQVLAERGISFKELAVYETVNTGGNSYARKIIETGDFDAVHFSSAGAVLGFKAAFPGLDMTGIRAICFGESAAARARELGMEVLITEDAGIEGVYNGSPLCRQGLT